MCSFIQNLDADKKKKNVSMDMLLINYSFHEKILAVSEQ